MSFAQGVHQYIKRKEKQNTAFAILPLYFWWHLKIREDPCYSIPGSYFLHFQQIGPWSFQSRLNAVNCSLSLPFPLVHLQAAVSAYMGQDFLKAERPLFSSKTQNRKKENREKSPCRRITPGFVEQASCIFPWHHWIPSYRYGYGQYLSFSPLRLSFSPLHVASCAL